MKSQDEFIKGEYVISTDKSKLDYNVILGFFNSAYWTVNLYEDVIIRSIANSLCFGVYHNDKQVGFARVITDYCRFAYLADVFIIPEYRKRGLSKWLMEVILNYYKFDSPNWMLATKDADGLYEKFGFKIIPEELNEEKNKSIKISTKYMKLVQRK